MSIEWGHHQSSDLFMLFCEATVRMYLEFTQKRILLNDDARSFQISAPAPVPAIPSSAYNQVHSKLISEVAEIYRKKPLYRGRPIKDVVAMEIPKEDLLSISKVNAYIGRVSELFKWAIKNGYAVVNPFMGTKVKVKKVAEYEQRDPFETDDLIALFSTPIFQGGMIRHPHYYWLPLLGLYTGARIDELCQLYLDDIYQIDDLWIIDFNVKLDKKLKNAQSARVIPIHKRLLDLGLLAYIAKLKKQGQARLFPELKKSRDGYSQAASKWFNDRYRKKCGVTSSKKVFHSFRHTVLDYLKQHDANPKKSAAIAGQKDESITTGRYGKPYHPSALASTMQLLDFPIDVVPYKAK